MKLSFLINSIMFQKALLLFADSSSQSMSELEEFLTIYHDQWLLRKFGLS